MISQSPCMTCALRHCYRCADPKSAHENSVYSESRRHNEKLLRVTDLTGSEQEHDSSYCLIADEHFNKDNVECPNRIPAINGITVSDAISLHYAAVANKSNAINLTLNKTMLNLTHLMLFFAFLSTVGLFYQIYTSINPVPPKVQNHPSPIVYRDGGSKEHETVEQQTTPQRKGEPIRPRGLKSNPTITK